MKKSISICAALRKTQKDEGTPLSALIFLQLLEKNTGLLLGSSLVILLVIQSGDLYEVFTFLKSRAYR
jgi:hypothetical protein